MVDFVGDSRDGGNCVGHTRDGGDSVVGSTV